MVKGVIRIKVGKVESAQCVSPDEPRGVFACKRRRGRRAPGRSGAFSPPRKSSGVVSFRVFGRSCLLQQKDTAVRVMYRVSYFMK